MNERNEHLYAGAITLEGNESRTPVEFAHARSGGVDCRNGCLRILVPTDFSPGCGHALRQATVLAQRCESTITLLYVVDLQLHTPPTGPVHGDALRADLWQHGMKMLADIAHELEHHGINVKTLIQQGTPSEEIVRVAREHDLIVMGRHDPKSFWHLFGRKNVNRVLEAAPCPVLVIREQ